MKSKIKTSKPNQSIQDSHQQSTTPTKIEVHTHNQEDILMMIQNKCNELSTFITNKTQINYERMQHQWHLILNKKINKKNSPVSIKKIIKYTQSCWNQIYAKTENSNNYDRKQDQNLQQGMNTVTKEIQAIEQEKGISFFI